MLILIFISFISYLIGSIPSGLILLKLFKNKDIRTLGSGNIGATNAVRVGGKFLGFMTFALDVSKAIIAILMAKYLVVNYSYISYIYYAVIIASLGAFCGHLFSLWLKFKGGKGVSVFVAIVTYINPYLGIFAIIDWITIFLLYRTSAIASLHMAFLTCILSVFISDKYTCLLITTSMILIFIKHVSNIKNIFNRFSK